MERQRLINCDFLNFGGFLDNISNKAKLVYFMFIVNADDKGLIYVAKMNDKGELELL